MTVTTVDGTSIPSVLDHYSYVGAPSVYVVNNGDGTVTPVNIATNTAGVPITVGTDPGGISIEPNGRYAYVTNSGSSSVSPINTATNGAATAINVGSFPEGIAMGPNGNDGWEVNAESKSLGEITTSNTYGGANPITGSSYSDCSRHGLGFLDVRERCERRDGDPDLERRRRRDPIVDGGLSDYSIAVTPNGRTAYVAGGDKVFPITTSSNVGGGLMSVNPVSSAPNALAISPDGTTAYVVSSSSGTGPRSPSPPTPSAPRSASVPVRRESRSPRTVIPPT